MREINVSVITEKISEMCIRANRFLPCSLADKICSAVNDEKEALPGSIMRDIRDNLDCAKELGVPICQDTGMAVIFAEIGQDVHFVGGSFEKAINEGVKKGYTEGLLRLSIVRDPLKNRENTGDNTPAVIHTKIVDGENVKITVAPKGFGSENMSRLKMMTPSVSREDIIDFVVETVKIAGGNPCPPMVLGVGIGGDFETVALNAKRALCRDVAQRNEDDFYAEMEAEILKRVNETNIGPQGFGGRTTALAVNIETAPTHIAGLPVAVNVGCHVTRHLTEIV